MADLERLVFADAKSGRRHHIRPLPAGGTLPLGTAMCNANPVQWGWHSKPIASLSPEEVQHFLRIACGDCADRAGLEVPQRKARPALQAPRAEPTV